MDVRFAHPTDAGQGTVAFVAPEGTALGDGALAVDRVADGLLTKAQRLAADRPDKAGLIDVVLPGASGGWDRVLLAEMSNGSSQQIAAAMVAIAAGHGLTELTLRFEAGVSADEALAVIEGMHLKAYRCRQHQPRKASEKPELKSLAVEFGDPEALANAFKTVEARLGGVMLARDLVNAPPNAATPAAVVEAVRGLESLGVEVEILDRKQLEEDRMGALLGVARGSTQEPYVAVMRWRGAESAAPFAMVGKGVCFDSGGLSLKPAKSMETMKMDMAGAAVVVGTMRSLAERKAKADVVGAIGLVENMPDADAQRPGDVVTSRLGKTIEVLNTDAEGRLVLADVLAYVIDRYQPVAMVDLATLTGAVIVALGDEHDGMFATDETLAERLAGAGTDVGEIVWRLPLGSNFSKQLESDVADLRNIGKAGKAGSAVAAAFLQEFVGNTPWAHLDIAGTAWSDAPNAKGPRGATGWGVRLLDRYVARYMEGAETG